MSGRSQNRRSVFILQLRQLSMMSNPYGESTLHPLLSPSAIFSIADERPTARELSERLTLDFSAGKSAVSTPTQKPRSGNPGFQTPPHKTCVVETRIRTGRILPAGACHGSGTPRSRTIRFAL